MHPVETVGDQQPRAFGGCHESGVGAVPLRHDQRVAHHEVVARTTAGTIAGCGQLLAAARRSQQQRKHCESPHASDSGPKAAGSKSAMVHATRVLRPTPSTGMAGPNSARTWRQAPHGADGGSVSLTTTIRRNRRAPCVTAAVTAAV